MTYNKKTQGKQYLSKHFQVWEFASSYSNEMLIEPKLIEVLEAIYSKLNCKRITVNSGYRTPAHSIKVGGYSTDDHTKGMAADIKCYDINNKIIPSRVVCITAEDMGIKRIGFINENSTHISIYNGNKWFGIETTGGTVTSFYTYFGIPKVIPTPITKPVIGLSIGSKVKIRLTASKYATGQTIPLRYKEKPYTVLQIKADKVLLKEIMSWVFIRDIK